MADTNDTQKKQEELSSAATSEPSTSTEQDGKATESSSSSTKAPTSSSEVNAEPTSVAESSSTPPQTAWQAIYSPQHNAYYFYNAETQETTWTNPLQPEASTSTSQEQQDDPSASSSKLASTPSYNAAQAAAIAAGIDPSLAYLDPSLAYAGIPGAVAAPNGQPSFTAKFNARTGAFTANDARDPTHLSEYERAKRMSEFYFDVNQWEQEVAQRQEEEKEDGGKKRKRPTKKDLERFKEQKRLKKIAKTAWLRQ